MMNSTELDIPAGQSRPAPYSLTVSEDGSRAIHFSGDRYGWSAALIKHGLADPGTHAVEEHVAWDLGEAFESDAEGGHSPFPLLDPRFELAAELHRFREAIV